MGNFLTYINRTVMRLGGTENESDQNEGVSGFEVESNQNVPAILFNPVELQDSATIKPTTSQPDPTDGTSGARDSRSDGDSDSSLSTDLDFDQERAQLEEEAMKHDSCGDDCETRRILEKIAAMVSVDTESRVNQSIVSKATQLVQLITDNLPNEDPVWTFVPEQRGSTTNGLKTGRLDEIDFLLKLKNVGLRAKDGWELVRDSGDLNIWGSQRYFIENKESNFQLFQLPGPGTVLNRFIHDFSNGKNCLEPRDLKYNFDDAVKSTVQRISQTARATEASSTDTVRFIVDTHDNILMFPCELSYAVKIDITPCLCFIDHDDKQHWLVPCAKLYNWQAVNEDPEELSCPVVRKAVRVMKTLRDHSESFENKSTPVRDVFCVFTEGSGKPQYKKGLSRFLQQYFRQALMPSMNTYIPSYAILGTVVQSHRTGTKTKICSLLPHSIAHLKNVDPHGNFLCTRHKPNISRITLQDSHAALIASYCKLMQDISTSETSANVDIQKHLPKNYCSNPLSLQPLVLSVNPRVYFFPADVKVRDAGWDSNSSCSAPKWEVYRLGKQEFTTWLLPRTPQPERWTSRTAPRSKSYLPKALRSDLFEEGRRELKELRSDDGVLSLENSYFLSNSYPRKETLPLFLNSNDFTIEGMLKALEKSEICHVLPFLCVRV